MTAYLKAFCYDERATRYWRQASTRPSDGAWVMTSGWQEDTSHGQAAGGVKGDSAEHGVGTEAEALAFVEGLKREHPAARVFVEGSGREAREVGKVAEAPPTSGDA